MDDTQLERWRAAIGRNAERYLGRFKRIEEAGGWAPGWNMAAFLHSTGWFCYRRMYGWAVLNFLGLPLLIAGFAGILSLLPRDVRSGQPYVLWMIPVYIVIMFALVPVFADSLYYRSLKKQLDRAGERSGETAARGPSTGSTYGALAFGIAWLLLIGSVLSVVNAAYADYTVRAKVSVALAVGSAMRGTIAEFHEREKRLPTQAEAVKFRHEMQDPVYPFVKSVAYDSGAQRIVITMREPFPEKRLALHADVRDGNLVWTCRTIDIEANYLPPSCRKGGP